MLYIITRLAANQKSTDHYEQVMGVVSNWTKTFVVKMSTDSGKYVVIKTANGTANDIRVLCVENWRVFDLKVHISGQHPLHPVRKIDINYFVFMIFISLSEDRN